VVWSRRKRTNANWVMAMRIAPSWQYAVVNGAAYTEWPLGVSQRKAHLAERTRIARELHDSLLQGFQGLMFRLQAVRNFLPALPAEAVQALDTALNRGDEAILEARDAASDLRESIVSDNHIPRIQ
jgi:signal transduction histidine kinase